MLIIALFDKWRPLFARLKQLKLLNNQLHRQIKNSDWDFPGAQDNKNAKGLTLFLQDCVRQELNRKNFFAVSKEVLEGSVKLKNSLNAVISLHNAAGWKMSGPLMVMAMCAIRHDVDPGLGNDHHRLQAVLDDFDSDITYNEGGFAATWVIKHPDDNYEQEFLACISVYLVRRFLLCLPSASTNLGELYWRGSKFDDQLLEIMGFFDQIEKLADLKTTEAATFLKQILEACNSKMDATESRTIQTNLDAIQAISKYRELVKTGKESFLTDVSRDEANSTAFRVCVGVLSGIFSGIFPKPVISEIDKQHELDMQMLTTCALLHDEVFISFLPCFEYLLPFDAACVISWHTILFVPRDVASLTK
jgi:hypothetical protein